MVLINLILLLYLFLHSMISISFNLINIYKLYLHNFLNVVFYKRNNIDLLEDLYYSNNYNFLLFLKILKINKVQNKNM